MMAVSQSTGTQDWRAVAQLSSGGERLLCVGESSSQVRAAYVGAWGEVVRDEDRPTVQTVSLQKWTGLPWAGQWEHQQTLEVPANPRKDKAGSNGNGNGKADADAETETKIETEGEGEGETDELA